jgi:hypothetical protein
MGRSNENVRAREKEKGEKPKGEKRLGGDGRSSNAF